MSSLAAYRQIAFNNAAWAMGKIAARFLLCLGVFTFSCMPSAFAETEVDVELFLAVDVSRSMSPRELEIQRRGYAEALVSDDVIEAIEDGLIGRIALSYVEWAGFASQRIIVDWTVISNRADAEAFAAKIIANFNPALRRTSISSAMDYAAGSFNNNGFTALRRVIDISGDGPNNVGEPVLEARRRTLDKGIIINGLPIMTNDGIYSRFDLKDLDEYYRHCVVGGPASFVIPVLEWKQFSAAVRQKLVLELAGNPLPTVIPAAFHEKTVSGYDCLVGEKMWEQRMLNWGDDL